MKTMLLTILLAGTAVWAGEPLITKTSGGGYRHPDWFRTDTCEVYANSVVLRKRFGSQNKLELREVRSISLTGIEAALGNAVREDVEKKENYLCDAPATQIEFRAGQTTHTLFSSGGCGSPRLERQGPSSSALRAIVDAYCPQTYDQVGR